MQKTDGQFNVPNEYLGEHSIARHVTSPMHGSHKFQKGVNIKSLQVGNCFYNDQ